MAKKDESLRPTNGDVMLFRVPCDQASRDCAMKLAVEMQELWASRGVHVEFFVVPENFSFEKITAEEMRSLGWVRAGSPGGGRN